MFFIKGPKQLGSLTYVTCTMQRLILLGFLCNYMLQEIFIYYIYLHFWIPC
jgi:hypothetical protein